MRGNARLPDLFILKPMTKKLATPGITTHNFNKRITHTGSAISQHAVYYRPELNYENSSSSTRHKAITNKIAVSNQSLDSQNAKFVLSEVH